MTRAVRFNLATSSVTIVWMQVKATVKSKSHDENMRLFVMTMPYAAIQFKTSAVVCA